MTIDKKQKCKEAIKALGADKVEKLYQIFGSEKIPIASIYKLLIKEKFLELFDGKKPIAKIAIEMKVSKMTLYRLLKENKNNNKT